jgi:Carboxypeptidase regulatory-like domain
MIVSRLASVGFGIFSVCALLICSGCGGPSYGTPVSVSGTVTVDDKPLANAVVSYICTEAREPEFGSFTTTAGADGKYAFEKVYPGPYEVQVSEAAVEAADPGMASALAGQDLQPAAGELKTDVGTTAHTFDIKLKRGSPPQG